MIRACNIVSADYFSGRGDRPTPANSRGDDLAGACLLLLLQDALVQVADDHAGQPLVMDEEALADRVGILLHDIERLFQDFVGAEAAIDKALDIADPVFDDLTLLLQIRLGAGLAVP